VRAEAFAVEDWISHQGLVDWPRGKIWSANFNRSQQIIQSVDLNNFERDSFTLPLPSCVCSYFLHPETRELWMIQGGLGGVTALNPDTRAIRSLGGDEYFVQRHFGAAPYWNPITRRVGMYGGYGQFRVNNERSEFDPKTGRWMVLEVDHDGEPWRRGPIFLVPGGNERELILVSGHGSPSGVQHRESKELQYFTGQFHLLDDVWQLNLATGGWRRLLPGGHFDPTRLQLVSWWPALNGLVLLESVPISSSERGGPRGWLLREARDWQPERLRLTGEVSRLNRIWASALAPDTGELRVLASDGIYRVQVAAPA
jgi:hypothetical protein